MTRHCGLLGREGEQVPEFDRVLLPILWAPDFDSRVPTAHAREVLRFVNGLASIGTCHVSQKTP
ncbi:unnamed protein product, partial [Staurois parvus]